MPLDAMPPPIVLTVTPETWLSVTVASSTSSEPVVGVQDPGPGDVRRRTVADRHVANRDGERRDVHRLHVQHAVERAAVDDRRARAGAFERHVVADVEVAGGGVLLAGAGDRERVGARRDLDDVRARKGVGLLDRRAQRADAGHHRAGAVARHRVALVAGGVDDEGGRARIERGEHGDEQQDRAKQGVSSSNSRAPLLDGDLDHRFAVSPAGALRAGGRMIGDLVAAGPATARRAGARQGPGPRALQVVRPSARRRDAVGQPIARMTKRRRSGARARRG